jgi:uncharacterized membrane protein YsdA (DUF1294 family)
MSKPPRHTVNHRLASRPAGIAHAGRLYFSLSFGLALAGAWGLDRLWPELTGGAWIAWLLSISLVAFLFIGLDKLLAKIGGLRVPESVLMALCLAGGLGGGLAGMTVFRHKTVKRSFRLTLVLCVVAEVVVLVAWWGGVFD